MTLLRSLFFTILSLTYLQRIVSDAPHGQASESHNTVDDEGGTDPSGGSVDTDKAKFRSIPKSTPRPIYYGPTYFPYYGNPYAHHDGDRGSGYGAPFPVRILAWDYRLRLGKGNVTVVDTENGNPLYTISKAPHRGFIITNPRGDKLLEANEKKEAACGFKYKYHTPMNVSFAIDPRLSKTDRWDIELYGNGRDEHYHKLKYYRAHKKNKGAIIDKTWGKTRDIQAARIDEKDPLDKAKWKVDTLFKIGRVTTLEINDPTIGDHYFIGLWAMVHLRWDRSGGTASNQQGNDPSGTVTGDGGTNPSSSHVSTKMAIPRFSRPRFTPRPIYTPYLIPYHSPSSNDRDRVDSYGNPLPVRVLAWDYRLRLDKGNVTVVDTENGHPLYTISKAPDRGFIITNQKGHKLLEANEKKKARCGFKYKYHTPMNVSFSIDPRFSKTDRWDLELYGNGRDEHPHNLKYYRAHKKNKGTIIDKTWGKTYDDKAATIDEKDPLDKSKWKVDTLWKIGRVTTLEINDPKIGDVWSTLFQGSLSQREKRTSELIFQCITETAALLHRAMGNGSPSMGSM
ncbi:hypothetical protein PSTG_04257 [Puccinia striiformis f. sp. tritici PST-78]|uniref:Uncharacterized protein n=1 Tax=Puccinia striiformis f. sp. tritici PST-78 TaxID=1165861 RepID=A0A0L0VUJ5_9BASI|nr:hypothetical protein PSTG_04257 [Puccinia striiformis f. sp. tritici PST-78]